MVLDYGIFVSFAATRYILLLAAITLIVFK